LTVCAHPEMHSLSLVCGALLFLVLGPIPVSAQSTDYPVITVGYRELRLSPEDLFQLTVSVPLFASEPTLTSIVSDNDTVFWEALGPTGQGLTLNESVSTFALVQMNHTGFFQFLAGLTPDNITLQWAVYLNDSITGNFSTVVTAATDFFAEDGHYWGLCEELVVLPGSLVGQSINIVWRARFHLVAESEEWTLLLDSSGGILDTYSEKLPCKACADYTVPVVVGVSVAVLAILSLLYLKRRPAQ